MFPTEERAVKLYHNPTALLFYEHWLRKVEEERFDRLGKMLGVIWDRDDVEESREQRSHKVPNRIALPLTLAIEPGLQEQIKKMFGRKLGIRPPEWAKTTELVDLFETPREDFIGFVDAFVRPKVVGT